MRQYGAKMKIDGIDSVAFNSDENEVLGGERKNLLVRLFADQIAAVDVLRQKMQAAAGDGYSVNASEAIRFAISFAAYFACKRPHGDKYETRVTRKNKVRRSKKDACGQKTLAASGPDGDNGTMNVAD